MPPSSPMPVTRMTEFDATRTASKLKSRKDLYGINSVYGSLDGAVNAYSAIKSYFDFSHCTESSIASFDAMHEWISTPGGLAVTLGSSLFFTVFANRANVHEKKAVGKAWKYLRELSQASRNAFKGFRGTILTAELFSVQNLRYLILPTSIGLGSLYVVNRLIMVGVKEERDNKIEKNKALFASLMEYGTFAECHQEMSQIELNQTKKNHINQYICINAGKEKTFVYIDKDGKQESVKNKYIFLKGSNKQEALYYVDYHNHAKLIEQANIKALKEELAKNAKAQHLSLLQLNELLPHGVAQKHFNTLKKEKAHKQPPDRSSLYFAIRAYNGLIDGLYLYIGIVSLVALSPQALIFAVTLSAIYTVLCVVSRLYEEYQSQQNILISKYKIDLALAGKELELQLIKLNEIAVRIAQETDEHKIALLKIEQKNADEALDKQLKIFEAARKTLKSEYVLSNLSIVLLGIKHGLPIYGAIVSAVFAAAFFCLLCSTPVPPLFVLGVIASGAFIIPGFILHAYLTRKKPDPKDALEKSLQEAANLGKMVADVKASFKLTLQDAKTAHQADLIRSRAKKTFLDWITLNLQADPLSDRYYPEGAEVFRSFCAGLLKGKKEIEFLLNPLQQPDEQGHYQDTKLMLLLIIPAAFIYAIVFALRAFAKNFSRTQANQENFTYLSADDQASPKEIPNQKNRTVDLVKIEVLPESKFNNPSEKKITAREENKKTVTLELINHTKKPIYIDIRPEGRQSPVTITASPINRRDTPTTPRQVRQPQEVRAQKLPKNLGHEKSTAKSVATFGIFSRPTSPINFEKTAFEKPIKSNQVLPKSQPKPIEVADAPATEGLVFGHYTF
jgi:hypothetical protein